MIVGDDHSTMAEKCRAGCLASLPIPEMKAQIWHEITNPNIEETHIARNAKMAEFYSDEQIDLVEPYFDKFFDELLKQRGCE